MENPYLYIKSKKVEKQTILTFTFNSLSDIKDEKIDEVVKEMFKSHNSFYLIDKISEVESCISILFVEGDI